MATLIQVFLVAVVFLFVVMIVKGLDETRTPEDEAARGESIREAQWGRKNAAMICQQCQARGTVRVKSVKRKKGISGGKATAALMTGGLSMLATGLSRKEEWTRAHCENCGNEWDF